MTASPVPHEPPRIQLPSPSLMPVSHHRSASGILLVSKAQGGFVPYLCLCKAGTLLPLTARCLLEELYSPHFWRSSEW